MHQILSGIETEYGLLIEGRGAEDQVDDATAFVRIYPGECFVGWDYRFESPRADLRGFSVDRLQFDPVDSLFENKSAGERLLGHLLPKSKRDSDIRSDRILPNGARLYNDHGHPEYSTPECWSSQELALHDKAGELAILAAAKALSRETNREVRVYKNNTDFHGASYGTHESYLVPRSLSFDALYRAVMPMLVVRQVLCGAGKVGNETGQSCTYQLSARADFFVEPFNTETLFRRPIFNTRDEPHAHPSQWIRLHVISGDANMITSCTRRKVSLVKMALALAISGHAPIWKFQNPVEAFQAISRDESYSFRIQLEGSSWTTAGEVFESYFTAAEHALSLRPGYESGTLEAELFDTIAECRELLQALRECPNRFASAVDWAAKRKMLESFMEEEGTDWRDPSLRSFDLEYHNADSSESLYHALVEMGQVEAEPPEELLQELLNGVREDTRARARSIAVKKFKGELASASWRSLVFRDEGETTEVLLDPNLHYPEKLASAESVGTFVQWISELES